MEQEIINMPISYTKTRKKGFFGLSQSFPEKQLGQSIQE